MARATWNAVRRGWAPLLVALLTACAAGAPVPAPPPPAAERVIRITAKRFEYAPAAITVKRGQPVVFELTATDHDHGFYLTAFRVQADLDRGKTVRVRFIPDKVGTFEFHCDDYCGDFHDDMVGQLVVID
jgi:cytochrome c oxidase subunit 2